jgi:hypothetical protein
LDQRLVFIGFNDVFLGIASITASTANVKGSYASDVAGVTARGADDPEDAPR